MLMKQSPYHCLKIMTRILQIWLVYFSRMLRTMRILNFLLEKYAWAAKYRDDEQTVTIRNRSCNYRQHTGYGVWHQQPGESQHIISNWCSVDGRRADTPPYDAASEQRGWERRGTSVQVGFLSEANRIAGRKGQEPVVTSKSHVSTISHPGNGLFEALHFRTSTTKPSRTRGDTN